MRDCPPGVPCLKRESLAVADAGGTLDVGTPCQSCPAEIIPAIQQVGRFVTEGVCVAIPSEEPISQGTPQPVDDRAGKP